MFSLKKYIYNTLVWLQRKGQNNNVNSTHIRIHRCTKGVSPETRLKLVSKRLKYSNKAVMVYCFLKLQLATQFYL